MKCENCSEKLINKAVCKGCVKQYPAPAIEKQLRVMPRRIAGENSNGWDNVAKMTEG